MKTSIRKAIKDKYSHSWKSLLGYTAEELKNHLESLFTANMTWDNYGSYWHIDHVRPKSWFKYKSYKDKDFKKCWAISNLQPLSAKENDSKGNRREG